MSRYATLRKGQTPRGRSGLRNRNRSGIGPYKRNGKRRDADSYGEWVNGKQIRPDIIAGRVSTHPPTRRDHYR